MKDNFPIDFYIFRYTHRFLLLKYYRSLPPLSGTCKTATAEISYPDNSAHNI